MCWRRIDFTPSWTLQARLLPFYPYTIGFRSVRGCTTLLHILTHASSSQTNKPTFDVLLAQIKTAEHFCTLVQQDVLAPTFGHDRQKVLVEAALAKATRELGEVRGAALSWNAPRHLTGQITSGPFSPPPLSFMEQASVLSSLSYHAFERRARRHRYFAELKKTGYIRECQRRDSTEPG